MKKILCKIIRAFKLKKEITCQLALLTRALPCVNLSLHVSIGGDFTFFNNSDIIAIFTYDETVCLACMGKPFFNLIIYCLCVKNSIDNY